MKNFLLFMLKVVAVTAAVTAAVYWLVYFLTAAGKKDWISEKLFKKNTDPAVLPDEKPTASCGCADAVCAVDMCMPY